MMENISLSLSFRSKYGIHKFKEYSQIFGYINENEFVGGENGGDEDRVTEWEVGLLSIDDLMPLSQLLILPELALVFSISPKTYKTAVEVNCVSQTTFSTLCGVNHSTAKGSMFETTDPNLDRD